MTRHRRSQSRTADRIAALAVVLVAVLVIVLVAWPSPARATTWIEQAQADLTCTGLADAAERATLAAPWLAAPVTAQSVTRYFRGPPQDSRQAQFRYLTVLAAIGWWAAMVNDQALRSDVYVDIGVLADRYAAGGDALFRQVARCARTQIIVSQVELGEPALADQVAASLARLYPDTPSAQSAEDWPLLLGLRAIRLEPRASSGIAQLATRSARYAANGVVTTSPERTSRLLAATSQALLALGDAGKARQVALDSLVVTGKPPEVTAAWRAMPVIYDSSVTLSGAKDAANVQVMLRPDAPPPSLNDNEAAFESLLRLSLAADTQERYDDMSRLQQAAVQRLTNRRGLQTYTMPFQRHALDELAATRDETLGAVARRDPAFAGRTLATYLGLYDTLVRQAQSQFIGDAQEQLFFQYKVDNVLDALAQLSPALPRSKADIDDTTFRLAQLRSYGRLTLATLEGELARSRIDPESRFSVERFFSLSTQTAVWLRALLESVRIAPGMPLPNGEALWKVFATLDIFYEETAKQYDRYVAFVRQKAPAVAELATPRPLPATEFMRRLRTGEALVATLVTPRDLYVWAVTTSGVTFVRQSVTARDIEARVQRLRASLKPGGDGTLPPFDAADAYELYKLVFVPIAPALKGITDIVWYGHGPLGALPPTVLVTSPPAKSQLSSATELAKTPFLVDRYAVAVLADLSLFPWHRDRSVARTQDARFLGVGAPLLTAGEIAGGPRSRSYELAGGLDGRELAQLPKLPESVDELKGLASAAGESNSTLWLGPEASEKQFTGDSLRGYRTIALATHGFLPGEVRGVPEPALMLALNPQSKDRYDGILTSQEIAALQLDADLVILSACNTASADGRPRGEAFTGLSQAFFTAGARSLMVSHWPVMSGAAVQLSVSTLERAEKQDLTLSRSLQQAIEEVRKAGASSAIEAHPSYWGAFVIVGDGR
ncbi:MAG TPA: CHAT domain-containing protein [Steroidobacteraceae bacterium]|nr:CHAT domain-containing protein [Steroidobacteraceae bacterium]HQR48907.1 CHAT domain-containing protein [Steroidobacteraceae bacterium]